MIDLRQGICALLAAAAIGAGAQLVRVTAAPVPEDARTSSNRWAYELQRALAHQRMKNTMYASTPISGVSGPMCPALVNVGRSRPIAVDLRGAWSRVDSRDAPFSKEMGPESDSDSDSGEESESESALDFFLNHISEPIVQAKCVNCHVEGRRVRPHSADSPPVFDPRPWNPQLGSVREFPGRRGRRWPSDLEQGSRV